MKIESSASKWFDGDLNHKMQMIYSRYFISDDQNDKKKINDQTGLKLSCLRMNLVRTYSLRRRKNESCLHVLHFLFSFVFCFCSHSTLHESLPCRQLICCYFFVAIRGEGEEENDVNDFYMESARAFHAAVHVCIDSMLSRSFFFASS